MMMEAMAAHWLGNLVILVVFGVATVACFAAAIRMLLKPGETDPDHPKYRILHDDR
jgi:hypothetical protein